MNEISMSEYFLHVYLLIVSYFDVRYKKIPGLIVVTGFVCAMVFVLFNLSNHPEQFLYGAAIGIVIYILGEITNQIGKGDAFIIMITGLITGLYENIQIILWSFLCTAVCSIVIIAFFKKKKVKSLPYVPFLACAYFFVRYFVRS